MLWVIRWSVSSQRSKLRPAIAGFWDGIRRTLTSRLHFKTVFVGRILFNVPIEVWNSLTLEAQWALNQQFLSHAIARADVFRLSTPFAEIDLAGNTFLAREIQFLLSHGYRIASDGLSLIK
jgi:hypothetical protein